MIVATDPRGFCTYLSPEWLAFTGLTADEGLGFGWRAAIHPDDLEPVSRLMREAISEGATVTVRFRLRAASGAWHMVVAGVSPAVSPVSGDVLGYIGEVLEIRDSRHPLDPAQPGMIVMTPGPAGAPQGSDLDRAIHFITQARAAAKRGSADRSVIAALDLALSLVCLKEMPPSRYN